MNMVKMTSKRSLFDFWGRSARYRGCGDSLGLPQSPHRIALREILKGRKKILDLACGDGANLAFLPAEIDYTGCDCSTAALETLMKRVDHGPMTKQTHVGDVSQLPVESASQDAVISSYSFEHFLEVPSILDECARVLRPGGLLVIFGPDYTAPNTFAPPQSSLLNRNRLRLLSYTMARIARKIRHAWGRDKVLFEYVEPLTLSKVSFQPDHDLTHLTNHRMISKYMSLFGYRQVDLETTVPLPQTLSMRILQALGFWGKFGDARVVMVKPEKSFAPRKPKVTERLIHRQPITMSIPNKSSQ